MKKILRTFTILNPASIQHIYTKRLISTELGKEKDGTVIYRDDINLYRHNRVENVTRQEVIHRAGMITLND